MIENSGRIPINLGVYSTNRGKFPPEELERYLGEHVAFSAEGTRILAHGTKREAVIAELRESGIHFSEVGWGFVPDPEVSSLL